MHSLTPAQALQLAADFALTADYIRAAEATDGQDRARLLETASRAAFLRAQAITRDEKIRPVFGQRVGDVFAMA